MGCPTPVMVTDQHWFHTESWPVAAYVISSSQAGEILTQHNHYSRQTIDNDTQIFYRICFDLEEARKNLGCIEGKNYDELKDRINLHHGCLPGFNKVKVITNIQPKVDVARQWINDGNGDVLGVYHYPAYTGHPDKLRDCTDDLLQAVKLSGKVFIPDVPRIVHETETSYPDSDDLVFRNSERTTIIRGLYVLDAGYNGSGWLTYNPRRAGTLLKRKKTLRKKTLRQCPKTAAQLLSGIMTAYFNYLWTPDYGIFNAKRYMHSYLTRTIHTTIENILAADRIARDRGLLRKMTLMARIDIPGLCYYGSVLERKHKGFVCSWLVPRLKVIKATRADWKRIRYWTAKKVENAP